MSWTVEFNGKSGIIEIVYVGHSTGADLRESTTKGIALTNELGVFDVLVDSTELEAPPLTDIYDLPAKQYDAEGLSRRIRIALIQPKLPSALKATEFYENACVNRGWRVRSFANRDAAIEWLIDTDSSNKPAAGDT